MNKSKSKVAFAIVTVLLVLWLAGDFLLDITSDSRKEDNLKEITNTLFNY